MSAGAGLILARKLSRYTRLSQDDLATVDRMASERVRTLDPRGDLIREGEQPRFVHLILDGWACRYKMLEDGRRQIAAFFVPGDMCDLNIYLLRRMDHSLGAITALRYAEITSDLFDETIAGRPRLTKALWWESLVAMAVQREWTTGIGQRSAIERLAHLMLEFYIRLEVVDLAADGTCAMPLTQGELADALGMTPVHANRTLQELRGAGLIELSGRRLTILDRPRLEALAGFNANYLHLQHDGQHLDASE